MKYYDGKHVKIATVYNNIASVYRNLSKNAQAKEFF